MKKTTKADRLAKLYDDARSVGFEVKTDGSGYTTILKYRKGSNKVLRGVIVYPDDSGFDATVGLDVARVLRTVEAMRAVLGIM